MAAEGWGEMAADDDEEEEEETEEDGGGDSKKKKKKLLQQQQQQQQRRREKQKVREDQEGTPKVRWIHRLKRERGREREIWPAQSRDCYLLLSLAERMHSEHRTY